MKAVKTKDVEVIFKGQIRKKLYLSLIFLKEA